MELNDFYVDKSTAEGDSYVSMDSPPKRPDSQSYYVNVPENKRDSKEAKSDGSDYLDMRCPWTPVTPPDSPDEGMELRPMLSEKGTFLVFIS